MDDSEAKPKETQTMKMKKKKKNKRKLSSLEEGTERPTKTHRVEQFDKHSEQIEVEHLAEELGQRELEEESPWRNLRLILSIQNKQLELHRKVDLAFHFVKMRVTEEGNSADQDYETVKLSRLIVFLNDWVQSLLIPSEKKLKGVVQKPEGEVIETWLDSRCWEIFKFCLEESLRLQVSLNFSRNLLRSIFVIAKNAVSLVNSTLLSSQESYFIGEGFKLHSIVLDCISLVFSSHGGLSNENLDLWMSTVDAVLELVHKVYVKNLDSGNMGVFAMRFSCLVLEPFAMFLRVHPTRKTGFHDFIDKLLEPLMHLLSVLHLQSGGSNSHWTENLLKLVEEVLFNGLFHPIHIDGFLSLRGTEKYATTIDGESKNSKTVIKSYHRHLFDKLERTLTEKKVLAMGGIGELFRLLVHRVKKLKGASVLSADTKMIGKGGASRNLEDNSLGHTSKLYSGSINVHLDKSYSSSGFSADTRKSLFDFFVQIMEPLLLNINAYLQAKPEVRPELLEVHGTLKSINNLLASFMDEKVYLRTEDTSEGACFNFLKKVYDTVISFSTNLLWLSKCDLENQKHIGTLTLLANEVFVAVGYLLEIEYEIIGNDLVSLWLMMFSYLTIGLSLVDVLDQSSLSSKIEAFGCQLINLYSQLRQVNNTIFALCKAVRLVISHDDGGEMNYTRFMAALPSEAYAKSVGNLLSSQDFKFAVCNAIKSIPEGQASGCIRQLTEDISESLEWMKVNCSVAEGNEIGKFEVSSLKCFDLQAELLGRGLSELYTIVLDSVTVTIGNSNLLGVSVKDLMTLLCPCMNSLVGVQPLTVNKFLCSVTGRNFDAGNKDDLLKFGFSSYWVFVFFFRLYMFCRSLYRQAISLMPPDLSRRMLEVMGDSSTAYSGKDWMERTDWDDGGYFSWIHQPSTSLLVVIQSVSNIYLQDSSKDCCPLIYVLNAMALQRLVDLNRQINSLEYLLQSNDNLVQKMLLDDASLSLYRKRSRKWARRISVLRQEAAGLTDYMMGHLQLVAEGQQSISSDDATCMDTSAQALLETEEWDFSICSMNMKSLPTAIWWILCQNIDIWCSHTAKKKLKLFLSLLIHTFIPSSTSSFVRIGKQHINEPSQLKKVTMHQISSELLSDSILYEQKFVRRYLASRFCRVLEKSVLPLFKDFPSGNVELKSSPHWPEVLGALEKSSVKVSSSGLVTNDYFSDSKSIAHSSEKLCTEICTEEKALPFTGLNFTSCHSLLNLLCWMPKGCLNSRSFSVYATYILNLERVVVGSLLECQGTLYSHRQHDLFRLFVSCRKALKYIIMAACEKKTEASQSSFAPILPEDSFSVLWLFKSLSLVVELQQAVSKDIATQVKDLIFSLMDHTSYVFLTLSKYQISHAVHFFLNAKRPCKEQPFSGNVNEQCNLIESNPCLDSSNCIEAWNDAFLVVKMLKEQAQSLLNCLKDNLCTEKEFLGVDVVNLNKFSSIVSCFSGFLWGLASAINDEDARFHDNKAKSLGWKREHVSELNLCISVFEDFNNLFLRMFLVEVDQQPRSYCDALNLKKPEYGPDFLDAEECSLNGSTQAEISCGRQQQKSGAAMACSLSSDIDDDSQTASVRRLQLKDASFAASIMTKVDSFDLQVINKPLLRCLLKGDYPEVAFSLRQLLIASSAILRLKLQINKISSLSSLVPCLVGISQVLLLELVGMVDIPDTFSFVWLDGVLKYLEELGNHFPSDNPTLYGNVYARMIELHLRAMGKCITLQGKRATLASHETESSTKTLHGHIGFSEASHLGPHCLDEFKARLRMSFKMFIKKPSRLHLLTVIQTIEKALVGVREGCTSIYGITTGNAAGGKISSIVAAGIDCFDLVIEFVSGRKHLDVVKEHIQSILAGLFNIILHLQNPLIFQRFMHDKGNTNPDAGSVILMCIEVLIRIFGKHALFQMKPWHVAQSLRIPAALFQDFHQIKLSEASISSHSSLILDNEISDRLASKDLSVVDRHFSIDLFAACCRLLYTVLKHHKSECERCISLLEASVSVLLHCLETVDTDSIVRKGYFSWELEEGVKCGCFLRRIYEEIRQQKESFGRHCSQFLANYIYVYSGYGPLKTGIKREIDEALRPGIYALIDACSADDLQYLHTVFGEGPCRNTLATLRHDYKLNFQYEGKV